MARMTEEEAEYWDEYYTKNPPEIDPNTNGGFATKSIVTHKTPTEIIGEMVRERIATSV
jgi:hypothetical protein